MRRHLTVVAVISVVAAVALPGTSLAATRTCPASPSGWRPFQILAEPGDPAPDRGDDPLWDLVEDLAAIEGLTLDDLAEVFGVDDVDAVYGILVDFMIAVDENGDELICVKTFPPHQQGWPAYIFTGLDNRARVPS